MTAGIDLRRCQKPIHPTKWGQSGTGVSEYLPAPGLGNVNADNGIVSINSEPVFKDKGNTYKSKVYLWMQNFTGYILQIFFTSFHSI